ncbi:LOW QUALITY PROTEIN: hypothetical protein RJ640_008057 [Escallonia rubra]|uniref:Uncharacterized protein n=1 Tax=Escallonia rubra TaxID=112253 RepID=A0AA88R7G7_9ASTE|nr:LOW QUALITY PROTEIN: hypothetical protein RJ640_008057 [Escallonia rubra]
MASPTSINNHPPSTLLLTSVTPTSTTGAQIQSLLVPDLIKSQPASPRSLPASSQHRRHPDQSPPCPDPRPNTYRRPASKSMFLLPSITTAVITQLGPTTNRATIGLPVISLKN